MLHRQSTLRDKKPDVQDQEKGAPKDEKTIPLPVPLRKDAPPEAKGGEVAVDLAKEKDGEAAKAIRISIKIDADDKDRPLIAIDG